MRARARIPGKRILGPAFLCAFTGFSVLIAAGHRTPHAFFGPTLLVGVALSVITALLVARRIAVTATDALPSTPTAAGRVALVHRIERAADVAGNSLALRNAVGTAVQRGLGGARPVEAQVSEPTQFRPPVGEDAQLGVVLSMLFAYRELTDADLGRYAAFLESPGGRWLTRVTHHAFLVSLAGDTAHAGPAAPAAANALVRNR